MATRFEIVGSDEANIILNYVFKNYINAEYLLDLIDVEIVEKSTSKEATGKVKGFPKKYEEKLNNLLKKYVKLIYFNNNLLLEVNSPMIKEFFDGKSKDSKPMYYVENGSKKSEKYFFFSVNMQRAFAKKVNADTTPSLLTMRFDKFGRPTVEKKAKRRAIRIKRKQFEIREGNSGLGITALWSNFSKNGKKLLMTLYGKKPSWPGFEGIKAKNPLINLLSGKDKKLIGVISEDEWIKNKLYELFDFDIDINRDDARIESMEERGKTLKINTIIKSKKTKRETELEIDVPEYFDTVVGAVGDAIQKFFKNAFK